MVARVVFGVNTPALGTITHTNRMSDAHWERVLAAYTAFLFTPPVQRPGVPRDSGSSPVAPTPPTPQEVVEKLSARILAQIKQDVGEFERRAAINAAAGGISPIDTVEE
jgi:hypothetical protein